MTTQRRADNVTRRTAAFHVDVAVLAALRRMVQRGEFASLSHAAERAFLLLLAAHGETVIRDEQEAEAA